MDHNLLLLVTASLSYYLHSRLQAGVLVSIQERDFKAVQEHVW